MARRDRMDHSKGRERWRKWSWGRTGRIAQKKENEEMPSQTTGRRKEKSGRRTQPVPSRLRIVDGLQLPSFSGLRGMEGRVRKGPRALILTLWTGRRWGDLCGGSEGHFFGGLGFSGGGRVAQKTPNSPNREEENTDLLSQKGVSSGLLKRCLAAPGSLEEVGIDLLKIPVGQSRGRVGVTRRRRRGGAT